MKKRNPEAPTPELRAKPSAALEGEMNAVEIAPDTEAGEPMRGAYYRPIKHPLSLRLDADVIAWFQRQGQGYQTRINSALREYIAAHSEGSGASQ